MKRPHNERFPSKDPFINADRSNSVPDIAPAPPKRNYKNRLHAAVHASNEINESVSVSSALNSPISNVVGAGHNVPRILGSLSANNAEKKERPKPRLPVYRYEDVYVPPSSELKDFLLSQPPDVVIGDGVEIKGNFQFDGLLRLDGRFQGQFITEDGDLIVGPTGILVSDLTKINRLLIDGGHVFGKIEVASIIISGKALVKGSIICKQLEILDSEATIIGSTHVDPDVLNQQEEELIHPEPSNEPIKVISYNKSKSTKSLHEKMSPEEIQELAKEKAMLEEQEKKTAEDLYNAKLEEKRKRKEAKQKEAKQKEEKEETKEKLLEIPSKEKPVEPPSKENKNEPPEPSKVEGKPVEDPPLEKKVESTANEDELKQFTEKRSAKVIQEAWKSNKGSTKPSLKADIDIDEASRKAEKKDLEEARKKEEEERMNKVEALQQKRSAKVIQNAWKSNKSVNSSSSLKPNEANEAEDILEDSLAGNLPPPPVENETVSVEKDDSPILQSHEVHLVSGALGSIPQILIQEKKDESIAEAMEEKSNAENEQKEPSSEVTENEMSKYGLSNEENKTIVEASTGENP